MTRALILACYLAVAAAAVALEATARHRGRAATFGATLSAVLRHRPARILLLAGWLWLGWHVFVRVNWR
jgi:Family of unknown function (DUF6186)